MAFDSAGAFSAVFEEGVRRLVASEVHDPVKVYDPVKGELFANDNYEPWLLVIVTVLIISLGSLAAGAGLGGGGIFVPIYACVLGVGAKAAVPMSTATILGGALGNMISIAFARHPDPQNNKPLIDYESCTFMQSGELLGVVFGVCLNLILPEILIIVFLAVLLGFSAYKTLAQGLQRFHDESAKSKAEEAKTSQPQEGGAEEAASNADAGDDAGASRWRIAGTSTLAAKSSAEVTASTVVLENVQVQADDPTAPPEAAMPESVQDAKPEVSDRLAKILAEDAVQFPLWAWAMLVPMTAYTCIYAILKSSTFSVCSPVAYWLWYFSPVPVLGLFMLASAVILKRRYQRKKDAGYTFIGENEEKPSYREMVWNNATLKQFPAIALLAGVAAGLLGIGGGMVIGPLFIQLDMHPKVGSSSCAFMILWTAISGVIQYYFADKLGWQFILYGIVIGVVSGQIGQHFVDHMLRKSGRPSVVIFLLGGIVLVACIAMTGTGVYKLISGLVDGANMFEFDTYDFQCHT
jgi:uncharacterized membrane protein YfcA